MEKRIILTFVKDLWAKLVSYFTSETIKESFMKAIEAFKDTLWNSIKDEVHKVATEIIDSAEQFIVSEEGEKKEEELLNTIMNKINLPVVLKPFKGIIKKIIKGKLEDLVSDLLNKAKDIIK